MLLLFVYSEVYKKKKTRKLWERRKMKELGPWDIKIKSLNN